MKNDQDYDKIFGREWGDKHNTGGIIDRRGEIRRGGGMEQNGRETLQLFDLMFKLILKEASPPALVRFINGLFGTDYPPDSAVTFNATESAGADNEKLEKIISDMILTIAGDAFLIEAQISDDENIALRVFQYGFAHAVENKEIAEDEGAIRLKMPSARVIYWETTRKTPDKVMLILIFPDESEHRYEIETFKVLNQSVETLGERNLALLYPFCLLKFRKEVKKPSTTAERRRELAAEMKELLRKTADIVAEKQSAGLLSGGDAMAILEGIDRMHEELYRNYSEFEEAKMELQERLKPQWKDYFQKGREEGREEGEKKGQNRIIELLEQGYTLEQIKQQLAQ